jgi:5-methylcytosine-specific restriction enzyme subunit McrC
VTIPIRNLYYLFSYAWAQFPGGDAVDVGIDKCPDLQNLFGKVLNDGVNRLMRRGLDRGYRVHIEETRSPRGRLLMDQIVKEQTLRRGTVICQHDDLSHDVLHNQIIKATARVLSRSPTMGTELAHSLRTIGRTMANVSDVRLSADMFRRVQLSRHNGQYAILTKLCEFVFRSTLPEECGSGARFADVLKDEVRMSKVFEDFLRNFYRHEQSQFRVQAGALQWDSAGTTDALALQYLPRMLTDITLQSFEQVIIFDAKFYANPFKAHHGSSKVSSGHLYQLLTYLQHAERVSPGRSVAGGLIYASAGQPLSLSYTLMDFSVLVEAIDLTLPWQIIRSKLLSLLEVGKRNSLSYSRLEAAT